MNSIKEIVEEVVAVEKRGKLRGIALVVDVEDSPTVQIYVGVRESPSSLAWMVTGLKLLDSRLTRLLESLITPDDAEVLN